MAFTCIRCRSPKVREKDRENKDVRWYQCQDCGKTWRKVVNRNSDYARKPYKGFTRGLRDSQQLRDLGYKS